MDKGFYNELLTGHNLYPDFKYDLDTYNLELEGVNPTCGDEITLRLLVEDGIVTDGAFTGDGCAISQASVDIMLGMVIGKTAEEAKVLADRFIRMIKGTATEEEIATLGDAAALRDISHMPARVKCAVLGWHTLDEILKNMPGGAQTD